MYFLEERSRQSNKTIDKLLDSDTNHSYTSQYEIMKHIVEFYKNNYLESFVDNSLIHYFCQSLST